MHDRDNFVQDNLRIFDLIICMSLTYMILSVMLCNIQSSKYESIAENHYKKYKYTKSQRHSQFPNWGVF